MAPGTPRRTLAHLSATATAHVAALRGLLDRLLPYLFTRELGRPEYARLARELMRRAP
jgi:hypothetical protein